MTKEERIEALEDKMDTLSDLSCQVSEIATCFEDVGETALQNQALALEKRIDERYEQLDEQRSKLEE